MTIFSTKLIEDLKKFSEQYTSTIIEIESPKPERCWLVRNREGDGRLVLCDREPSKSDHLGVAYHVALVIRKWLDKFYEKEFAVDKISRISTKPTFRMQVNRRDPHCFIDFYFGIETNYQGHGQQEYIQANLHFNIDADHMKEYPDGYFWLENSWADTKHGYKVEQFSAQHPAKAIKCFKEIFSNTIRSKARSLTDQGKAHKFLAKKFK